MRFLFFMIISASFAWAMTSCKSSSPAPVFCDTACISDTIRKVEDHPMKPQVYIAMKGCMPDTIGWTHRDMVNMKKIGFYELVGKDVRLNKQYIKYHFNDTSFVWMEFNDCISGRGYLVKLVYNKVDRGNVYTSALNSMNPKFVVEDGLIAYYDQLFIYAQDWRTGKVQQMKMNDTRLEIDHDNIHKTIDSVHISRDRIWANITINDQTLPKEKKISF